ncbi:MAG: glycosyltransferase family 39 protein [Acidobacteriota bacterium]
MDRLGEPLRAGLEKAGASLQRYYDLIFGLCSLPFIWQISNNIAIPLRFEDALIVLRYARNLVAGHGFVYNLGEPIMGVTTPLYTLLSTLFVLAGGEHAPAVQNVAGVLFLVLQAWLAARIVRRTHSALLGLLTAVLILTNLNFNYLYFGMETHCFAFLVLLAFYLFLERKETWTGVVLGVAFLTRYDAALLALLIGLAMLFERRRLPFRLTLAFFAVVTPWLAFSMLYFQSILPSSLGAKEGYYPAIAYIRVVFDYYQEYFAALAGVFRLGEGAKILLGGGFPVLAAVGAWSLARVGWRNMVLIAYGALQVVIYAFLGPDPGFRWHYYTLNPILTILFLVGLFEIFKLGIHWATKVARGKQPVARSLLATVQMVALGLAVLHLARASAHTFRLDPHSRQLYDMAAWLDSHYDDETSLLQPSIGILGYETNMRMIDHAGLVTRGLYYYDSSNHTPMAEVMRLYQPDLVLIPQGEDEGLTEHGYLLVHTFRDPSTYLLYERGNLESFRKGLQLEEPLSEEDFPPPDLEPLAELDESELFSLLVEPELSDAASLPWLPLESELFWSAEPLPLSA